MRQPPPPTSTRSGYAKPHNMVPPTIVQLTDSPSRHTNSGSWCDTTPVETRPARRPLAPNAIGPEIVEQEYWNDKEVVLGIYHCIVPRLAWESLIHCILAPREILPKAAYG
ncbi:hypothetical protein D9619_000437 [Psilocybe cf. subviscida]|uniref:Uncharacterized protein n=1 Tax=Psilocybe cf. subviscida TaxID=2480587 RepID=A0A8H5F2H9_9AGAR|nr:hypothetical protein D9619_000437 [Psilocybe cf. subviscida]